MIAVVNYKQNRKGTAMIAWTLEENQTKKELQRKDGTGDQKVGDLA